MGSSRSRSRSSRSSRSRSDLDLVKVALAEAEEYYRFVGTAPTLREVFYRLCAKGILAVLRKDYKRFSRTLAKARYRGEFPWELIKDTTRPFPRFCEVETRFPERPLTEEDLRRALKEYVDRYTSITVNPWEDQKYRVFIVLEKESLLDMVASAVKKVFPHGVYQVRAIRGYDSATDLYQLAVELELLPREQVPVILQIGDYDPTGEDIVRDFRQRLAMLSRREIIFEKVAVTLDHVVEHDLPCKPERMDEIMKMRRDSRYKKYIQKVKALAEQDPRVRALIEKYGTHEIRVEVEALTSLRYEAFLEALKRAIERYFDWQTYERVTRPKIEALTKRAEGVRKESLEALRRLIGE